MRLGYIIHHASGLDRSDVHFLVLRFDQRYGFKPGEGESWIANDAQERFGLVSTGEELPDLAHLRELIGKEPEIAEEYDLLE